MTRSIYGRAFGAALLLAPLPAAAAAPQPDATVLTLSVTGHASHAPDAMTAELQAVGRAANAAEAQIAVNRMMATALHGVDRIKGLVARTGGYSVVPADQKHTAWIARQNLMLRFDAAPDGDAAAPVRTLIGRLQQAGMQLQSLNGTLSAKTETATRDRAIADAAKRLRTEAATVARTLGKTVGPIRSIQLNGQTIHPVIRTMALAASETPPVARSGPIEERVSLSGTIELRPASP